MGQSVRKISKKLGYPKSTVQDTISRYKTKGGTHSAPRCGRPSLLDENAKNYLKEIVENKPRITVNEIQKDFAESDLQIYTNFGKQLIAMDSQEIQSSPLFFSAR